MEEEQQEQIEKFRKVFRRCGKYNLNVQVSRLSKLAQYYHKRYTISRDWTDCLKAHGLYNSLSARKPRNEHWKEKSFRLQQEFWGDNSTLSYANQRDITLTLVNQLEDIRQRYRRDIAEMDSLVGVFKDLSIDTAVKENFCDKMKSISLSCSESMVNFASKVIKESISLLNSHPPCDFEAVAIGSIARGEATPYSDLEYLFLIEESTPSAVSYFETLAVSSYFLIGNLAETKLSHLAIDELQGWFEDTAKNGFKIDGLSEGAGNIPTGNGSKASKNHFIVSAQDLARIYGEVLEHPDPIQSLRGDLTAMLAYSKSFYSHRRNGGNLLDDFKMMISSMTENKERKTANLKMLRADAKKFNFVADDKLFHQGFNADVKKELYRFPSIMLLDICLVIGHVQNSSWESLDSLAEKGKLSNDVSNAFKFLLAASSYIRLATYLHHDSQDDRISLAQSLSGPQLNHRAANGRIARRWFLPCGLFSEICSVMTPLKECLAEEGFTTESLQLQETKRDPWWSKLTTMYYSGRYSQALSSLKQKYPDLICDPLKAVLPSIQSASDPMKYNTMNTIAEILYWCTQYNTALKLYSYMTDENISDESLRKADCYHRLGKYETAVEILSQVEDKTLHEYFSLGQGLRKLGSYEDAEQNLVQALQLAHDGIFETFITENCGNPLKVNSYRCEQAQANFVLLSPKARLNAILQVSANIIACLISLGDVYRALGKHTRATSYYLKSIGSIDRLYGKGAVVPAAGHTLNNLGINFVSSGKYDQARDCYYKALSVYRNISQGDPSLDVAETLFNLGYLYISKLEKKAKGRVRLTEALGIYEQIDPDHLNVAVIESHLEAEIYYTPGTAALSRASNHVSVQKTQNTKRAKEK